MQINGSSFATSAAAIAPPPAVAMGGPARSLTLGSATIGLLRDLPANDVDEGAACQLLFRTAETPAAMLADGTRLDSRSWVAGLSGTLYPADESDDLLALVFPLDNLSRRLANQVRERRWSAQPIAGAARMCVELGRSCLSQADVMSSSVAHALGESLIELAKLAIIEQLCLRRAETVRETVRTRIEAFIQRNLFDPDLSIDRVAERMRCTKRYLHKVFSDEGQTLSQYIWAERLERCRQDLGRADLAAKSITEIAFAWGFSNAAHFSRSFRARFGQPPRDYRRALQGMG